MPDEGGNDEVVEIRPDEKGKYPEVVPWNQYVGIKEKFNKVESELKGQIANLEERVKSGASAEELEAAKLELAGLKTEHQKVTDELKNTNEKNLTEKRATLISKGVPEEQVKEASGKELDIILKALEAYKPKADMGGGGGGGELRGSPMELAQRAYAKK